MDEIVPATEALATKALKLGATSVRGTELDVAMIRCVLDGRNTSENASGKSFAAALARVIDVPLIIQRALDVDFNAQEWDRSASTALKRADGSVAEGLLKARAPKSGTKGTTSWFAQLGDGVQSAFGRCWLGAEVAIVGAASSLRTGHFASPTDQPWGLEATPSALLRDLREHTRDLAWWEQSVDRLVDDLDRSAWLLASIVTTAGLVEHLSPRMDVVYRELPDLWRDTVLRSLELIARGTFAHSLPSLIPRRIAAQFPELAALLVTVAADDDAEPPLDAEVIGRLPAATARNALIQMYWQKLSPPLDLDSAAIALLTSAESDLVLAGSKSGPPPKSLRNAVRVEGPWALLQWLDREDESEVVQQPLVQVAEDLSWFEPAE